MWFGWYKLKIDHFNNPHEVERKKLLSTLGQRNGYLYSVFVILYGYLSFSTVGIYSSQR